MGVLILLGVLIIGYLIGSIPTSIIIAKKVKNIDIREHGSHNAGGTNVGRVLGKRYGVLVIALDMLKTIFMIWATYLLLTYTPLSNHLLGNEISYYVYPVALAVSLGHCFPIFASFKGGKAVATSAGTILAFSLPITLVAALAFFLILKIKKHVSLGSLLGSLIIFLLSFLVLIPSIQNFIVYSPLNPHFMMIIVMFLESVLLFIRHIPNIKRLFNGTESKIKWMK